MKRVILILTLILHSSCSLLTKRGKWGKEAIFPIRGSRIIDSFKRNISSPHVWAPLATAALLNVSGWDEKVSNWVSDEKFIYHKQDSADNWSDHFNNILRYELYLTTILTPSLDEDGELTGYLWNKAKGGAKIYAADLSSRTSHDWLTDVTKRERPNGENFRSFPSGHSTEAGSKTRLNSGNLDSIEMDEDLRFGLKTTNVLMASGVLWARLEGKRHYPSDVLSGYALGTFVSGFIYDAFMNLDPRESFVLAPTGKGRFSAQYSFLF